MGFHRNTKSFKNNIVIMHTFQAKIQRGSRKKSLANLFQAHFKDAWSRQDFPYQFRDIVSLDLTDLSN